MSWAASKAVDHGSRRRALRALIVHCFRIGRYHPRHPARGCIGGLAPVRTLPWTPRSRGPSKAARWDYQRDRIYIRTDTELKKAKRKKKSLAKKALRIVKVTFCEPLRLCPRCQGKGTQTFRTITRRLHDLRFGRSGVAVQYQFPVFWCPACQAFTPWPTEFWERTTYGQTWPHSASLRLSSCAFRSALSPKP